MEFGILENLFEDDILKIKFGNWNFWKIYLKMTILKLNWEIRILEILFEALKVKFGIFGKFEKWYFKD